MLKRKKNNMIEQTLDLFAPEESELSRSNSCISILKKCPQLNCSALLEIQPLAPLSMVSELPGSYYKTLKMPDKKILCGLFENLLGWHINRADRNAISKDVKRLRETQINEPIIPYTDYAKGSTYTPLLMDYFEVLNIKPVISKVVFYDDVWKKAYRREDAAKTHIGGTPNVSYEIIAQKNEVMENGNEKELQALFDDNLGKFPLYYSTPSLREYIAMEGQYEVNINIDAELYSMLQEQIQTNNLCYLGNSEGWIDLKFKKI